jgi:ribosomal protein S18 acetylase RimI-like enzyme
VAADPRPRRGYTIIVTLAVDPTWRRRGVGERLMRACEAHARQPRLQLQVRKTNTAAIRLYQKLGYAIISDLPHYYSDGGDGFLMEKRRG